MYREATCPACGHHVAVPLFDGGAQPLATLAWPETAEAARSLMRFPLDFVRCVDCGHVFNRLFDYVNVPYGERPNLMFNKAANWTRFLGDTQNRILGHLPAAPLVVEIGHGDGSFLAGLAGLRPRGRYIGFDPHGVARGDGRLEFRNALFDPARHLAELRPDLVISRHVLEHLVNPLGFLQAMSFAAERLNVRPIAYLEVPCIDRALRDRRIVDLYYEHSSQFTTRSFERMLARCSRAIIEIGHGYGDEVVFGVVRLGSSTSALELADDARAFALEAQTGRERVQDQLAELHRAGTRIAIWGGTGKSAAFMLHYNVDKGRFPLVVDSDPAKVGTYVPGTGQEIQFRDALLANPAQIIIIPPQWRAADIVVEMERAGISFRTALIEHRGRLVDFHRDSHPYRRIDLGRDASCGTPDNAS